MRRRAVLLSHPYAMRYGRVGPVLPIGLLNHNLSFSFCTRMVRGTPREYLPRGTSVVCPASPFLKTRSRIPSSRVIGTCTGDIMPRRNGISQRTQVLDYSFESTSELSESSSSTTWKTAQTSSRGAAAEGRTILTKRIAPLFITMLSVLLFGGTVSSSLSSSI